MQIRYLGWQSFLIRGREGVILTQPFASQPGWRFPKVTADIVLAPAGIPAGIRGRIKNKKGQAPLIFAGPGEYEVRGIEIWGLPGGFWLTMEDRRLLWFFADKLGKNGQLRLDFQPDVLLLRIGKPGKDWQAAMKQLLDELSPAIIIPFPQSQNAGARGDEKWAQPLLDLLDMEKLRPQSSLVIKVGEALAEERRLVLLSPPGG